MTDPPFTPFNLATMSGIFPGTHTQTFQRVRMERIDDTSVVRWGQILWYEAPPACVLLAKQAGKAQADEILLRLAEPKTGDLNRRLIAGIAEQGWRLRTCGSCCHWQPNALQNEDSLPLGRCNLRSGQAAIEPPDELARQSFLALDCPDWQVDSEPPKQSQPALSIPPLSKIAEVSESKLKPWQRLQRKIGRWLGAAPAIDTTDWRSQLLERSGVGAGTEPCFACQGRIANLAALTVASTAGDKQTFSVWRCRSCYSLYLSDWTDRWERLENLETEEIIYRLAPLEAAELLSLILSVPGGEHPAQRAERSHLREWFHTYLADRPRLSRQIKQGR